MSMSLSVEFMDDLREPTRREKAVSFNSSASAATEVAYLLLARNRLQPAY